LGNYWKRKIDKEYRELLDTVDIHLSICDAMSEEYNKRYNKSFIAFHNPIEIGAWLPYIKSSFTLNKKDINILYSGRIGIGIEDSLLEVAAAIDLMNDEEINIKLHIQTPSKQQTTIDLLQNFKCVVINPFVKYSQIPEITSKADILLLANDFSRAGINFLKFSMPTKASEYMISGTPVLVYASDETAVLKFFSKHKCGYCLAKQNTEEIVKAIKFMIDNEEYRKKISQNALKIAKENFSSEKVRNKFQGLLKSLYK
jgi:glycosyltransferase involved in cell wall biosynthesis